MSDTGRGAPQGLGMGMRMSTELVSSVFVGGGIGYLLDYWFHTKPWLTVIFFMFGMAAGFRNMYRIATQDPPRGEGKDQGKSIRAANPPEEPPRS
ncbi:MAG: AtpZ/AtpI family protein [Magnetococcales bacterium]|nr:AtpZ/AtpI family protein [Magnetococcales bacterium]MBF0262377.1 AtpZ/AtpI family protein [Magnetococcales bacterium]